MNYSSLASAMGQGLGNLGNTVSQSSINALNYTTLTNTTLNKSSSPMSADGAQGAYNAMMKSYPDFFKNAPKADVVKVLSGKTPSASMGEEDTRKAQAYLQFIQSTNQLGSGSSQAGGAAANATPIVIPETLVQGSYTRCHMRVRMHRRSRHPPIPKDLCQAC
jgi:hypothetical protein